MAGVGGAVVAVARGAAVAELGVRVKEGRIEFRPLLLRRSEFLREPGLFEGRTINVTVETMSELTVGMTVADYWRITDRPHNVHYLRHADADGFFALLTERLGRLP